MQANECEQFKVINDLTLTPRFRPRILNPPNLFFTSKRFPLISVSKVFELYSSDPVSPDEGWPLSGGYQERESEPTTTEGNRWWTVKKKGRWFLNWVLMF